MKTFYFSLNGENVDKIKLGKDVNPTLTNKIIENIQYYKGFGYTIEENQEYQLVVGKIRIYDKVFHKITLPISEKDKVIEYIKTIIDSLGFEVLENPLVVASVEKNSVVTIRISVPADLINQITPKIVSKALRFYYYRENYLYTDVKKETVMSIAKILPDKIVEENIMVFVINETSLLPFQSEVLLKGLIEYELTKQFE